MLNIQGVPNCTGQTSPSNRAWLIKALHGKKHILEKPNLKMKCE